MIECRCACCGRTLEHIVTLDPRGAWITVGPLSSVREEKAPHCGACGSTTFVLATVKR